MYDEYKEIEYRLICVRICHQPNPTEGSTESTCTICGEPVWIAPKSLVLIPEHTSLVKYCTECAAEAMRKNE